MPTGPQDHAGLVIIRLGWHKSHKNKSSRNQDSDSALVFFHPAQAEDFLCIRRAADAAGELQRLASAGSSGVRGASLSPRNEPSIQNRSEPVSNWLVPPWSAPRLGCRCGPWTRTRATQRSNRKLPLGTGLLMLETKTAGRRTFQLKMS